MGVGLNPSSRYKFAPPMTPHQTPSLQPKLLNLSSDRISADT